MLNTSTNSPRQIALGDRVTFDTDEGYQAGTVSDLRRDVGNGELHAWVELDHQWPGVFRAVPLAALVSIKPAQTERQHLASLTRPASVLIVKGSACGKTSMSHQLHECSTCATA